MSAGERGVDDLAEIFDLLEFPTIFHDEMQNMLSFSIPFHNHSRMWWKCVPVHKISPHGKRRMTYTYGKGRNVFHAVYWID